MTILPLSARLSAPEHIELPRAAGLHWRQATLADLDAMYACARAMDVVDHPHFVTTREELRNELTHSYVDPASDFIVGVAADERVLAFGGSILSPGQETMVRCYLVGGVHPEVRGQGIGRELLAWQEQRGMQQLASSDKALPGRLLTWAEEIATASVRLYTHAGFTIGRYFLQLTRDLSDPIADRAITEELRIVPYSAALSEPTRLARNDAFRDHWGSQPTTRELWDSFANSEVFRADLSVVALTADGDVAGFVLASVNREDWEASGYSSAYIDLVGVSRAWRKRGVAPALLVAALQGFAREGVERAVLDVDSDSPTGATGLYAGLGFLEESRNLNFVKDF